MKLLLVLFYSLVNAQHPHHVHMGKASKKGPTQIEPRTTPLPQLGQSFFNFPTIKIPDFTIPTIPTIPTFSYPFITNTRLTTTTISTSSPITTSSMTTSTTSSSMTTTPTPTITTNSTNNDGLVDEGIQLLFLIGVFVGVVLLSLFIVFVKNRRKRNIRNNGIINLNYEEQTKQNQTNILPNLNYNSNSNVNVNNNIFDADYETPVSGNHTYEYDSYQNQNQNEIYEEAY